MTSLRNQAAGFFQFPARITTRIMLRSMHIVRAERVETHAARELFRVRHGGGELAKETPVEAKINGVPVRGTAARVTLRV